ncbi:diguanylate cyclase (GGDEF)-like protein [Nocardia pseudobrasiliensis]|uniref:Diguanylate cyclase (GGDEF)-like protein n=2 Tax=Nocardia pseudobrasiliensis TaxID=45979 RepID=A0A370I2E2_9NOCA|nr:diguanylate cyclase (GGDEF)-like protein [Nocardia pseudobrasiliensis]
MRGGNALTDSPSMYRTWWRDRVDYRWLVETIESFGALGKIKFMLGAGGIVMLLIAILASIAQGDTGGPVDMAQGIAEALVAGAWTVRWWFLPWPRETESLIWIAIFDIDTAANDLLVQDRVIGVLGVVLLMAMGGYVAVFHSPRILALHIGWSVLASAALATLIATGHLPVRPPTDDWKQDLALGLDIVLVMLVVVGVILPFVQFCHWLFRINALSDPLTGLLNRRGLDSFMLSRRGQCQQRPSYVAMLDLDRFKSVNDTFGHPFGDEVLMLAARRLRAAVAPGARLARTGGEEFVVIGYLTEDPEIVAQRLRRAIESMRLPVTITASVGLVVYDPANSETEYSETTYRDLLSDADSAMYRAKHLGGNTVVIADRHTAAKPTLDDLPTKLATPSQH